MVEKGNEAGMEVAEAQAEQAESHEAAEEREKGEMSAAVEDLIEEFDDLQNELAAMENLADDVEAAGPTEGSGDIIGKKSMEEHVLTSDRRALQNEIGEVRAKVADLFSDDWQKKGLAALKDIPQNVKDKFWPGNL